MLRKRKHGWLLVLLVIAALTGTACTQSAEELNQEGNDRFGEAAYLEALHAYQSAQIESPELAEPYYNAANALYREGAYDQALAQMEMALQYAQLNEGAVQSLAQHGFYNLGNTSYSQESWEAAVAAYREALLRNPDDENAKYNLELALQQLQQQQEQQEQEQEQQNDEQDQEQNQEQSENGEGQEDEQDQSQDQSQDGEDGQQEEDQEQSDDNAGNEGEQEQEQQDQSQSGQQQGEEGTSPSTVPPSGQGMTAEQAEQLLAAIAAESSTLQERLGQIFRVPALPPVQDW